MTTGTRSLGTPGYTDFYYNKTWAGVDNKASDNPYSSDMYRVSTGKAGKWEWTFNGSTWSWVKSLAADIYLIGDTGEYLHVDSNQDLKCLAKISDSVRGHSFNAGVFMAEMPESLATVVNSTRAVLQAATSLYRGDIAGATRGFGRLLGQTEKKALRRKIDTGDLSGAWLALRYGWDPLLNDVYELMKLIESRNSKRSLVYRASSTKYDVKDISADKPLYTLLARRVATVRYKVTLSEQMSAWRTCGLVRPWSVIWEKIPFSFVWDWFMPVGSYLDSLSLFQGFDAQMCRTTFERSFVERGPYQIWKSPSNVLWRPQYYSALRIVTSRQTGPLVVPKPSFKTLEKAFSLGHLRNASALIHQMVRKRPF